MQNFDRDAFNEEYLKFAAYTQPIVEAANKITKPHTAELEKCVDLVLKASRVDNGEELDYDLLERMAICIPSLCLYIQCKLNEYELRNDVEVAIIETQVVEELERIRQAEAKGNAPERLKKAEASQFKSRIVDVLDAQVCSNFKNMIQRADKVYEGIKKVLDARARENDFNRKSQKYNT